MGTSKNVWVYETIKRPNKKKTGYRGGSILGAHAERSRKDSAPMDGARKWLADQHEKDVGSDFR